VIVSLLLHLFRTPIAMKLVFASLFASASAGIWEDYKQNWGKLYNGDESVAKKAYEENRKIIDEQNAMNDGLTFGENQFTDMTHHQFKTSSSFGYKAGSSSKTTLGVHKWQGETLAVSVDWRAEGKVNDVKDQGQCGSCWAFSTAASTEGSYAITEGTLVSVSEQMLVDCSTQNSGCNGGLMDYAFQFFQSNQPASEATYKYKGTDGTCRTNYVNAFSGGGSVTGYTDVTSNSVTDMASAVNDGVVSIAIQANQRSFQSYRGGVLEQGSRWAAKCGQHLDHGVAVVGYGKSDGGVDYWNVRNSWGSGWGEGGYIRIEKSSKNTCGVLSQPSYPVVTVSVSV